MVRNAVLAADVEHGDDVGVTQRGDVPRFLLEPRETRWICCQMRRQYLQRDVTPEPDVSSAIHFAHPPEPSGAISSYTPSLVPAAIIGASKHSHNEDGTQHAREGLDERRRPI
jgi:hypothetical protein